MKVLALTLALAGVAAAAPVNAQILSRSRVPTTNTTVNNNGQWYSVGQDNYGTVYERRTYDGNGNLVIQRARRDSNGNLRIISSRTVANGNNDCNYNGPTVGGIILGGNNANCGYNNNGRYDNNGGWYRVGNANSNSIYERRTTDRYGNTVVQRARRNSNGSFTILSSRTINNNNGSYNNGRYDNGGYNNGGYNNGRDRDDKEWQKEHKKNDKDWQKEQKHEDKGHDH